VPKKNIYIDAQHGLGNRLRAIASGAAIAEQTGRELVIVWQADNHCEAEFQDLFDYAGPVLAKSIHQDLTSQFNFYNYMEIEPNSQKDALVTIHDDKHLYVRTSCVVNNEFSDWNLANQFLRALKPNAYIQKLLRPYDLGNHVGVHIRMELGEGKHVSDYEDDSFLSRKSFESAQFWRTKSHYAAFINRLEKLFAEDQDVRVFLASDNSEAYKVLTQTFGDRVEFLSRTFFDRSQKQIQYALADAILLSRCKGLIGSSWSSFTELSMRLAPKFNFVEMSGRDF